MKVILVARNALAAYLINSAVRRREHQRRLVERQRPVDIAEHLSRALVRGADHDPVREFEIADRGALAQKFRIGGNDEIGRRADLADQALDLIAGTDRHRRFGDHHGEAGKRAGDLACGGVDVAQVGMAVAAPRRGADRDEHRIGLRDWRLEVGRKIQPFRLHIGGNQNIEAGLEYRNVAAPKAGDLVVVLVNASHLMAEVGKTGAGHQPHVARANHGDPHESTCPFVINATAS